METLNLVVKASIKSASSSTVLPPIASMISSLLSIVAMVVSPVCYAAELAERCSRSASSAPTT